MRTRATTFRLLLACALVLVVLAGAGAVAWLRLSAGEDDQGPRDELMASSEQFMLRMGTYGPELLDEGSGEMPEYRSRVGEVITAKFKASFDEQVVAAEQLVKQGASLSADVFATGVASMDEDSARTLVAGVFEPTFTRDGETVEQEPGPFRIELALVKVDGEWLVDDFTPVSGSLDDPLPGLEGTP